MSLKLYAIGEIYVSCPAQGISFRKLAEEASLQVSRKTNSQMLTSIAAGYAGECPGVKVCEIDVTNAVPAVGFEFDAGDIMDNQAIVQFTIAIGGQGKGVVLVFNGYILEDNFTHAVNTEGKFSFKARGQFSKYLK